jgi:ubiquinone/menaquinone biosynthesis C-methylase UbiE
VTHLLPDEYSSMAGLYDPATAWALDPLRRELTDVAVAEGAGRALDVCCGTGRQCLFLAQAGIRSIGVDLSPAMLARASHAGVLRLVRGDAGRLPFSDGTFQFTSITMALHEKPPHMRPAIMFEILRVTVPGGLVAVVDYLSPQTSAQMFAGVGIKAVERLAGREHYAHYCEFMDGGGLVAFLSKFGIVPYEIRRRLLGVAGVALIRRPG